MSWGFFKRLIEHDVVETIDPVTLEARVFELAKVVTDPAGLGHPKHLPA